VEITYQGLIVANIRKIGVFPDLAKNT